MCPVILQQLMQIQNITAKHVSMLSGHKGVETKVHFTHVFLKISWGSNQKMLHISLFTHLVHSMRVRCFHKCWRHTEWFQWGVGNGWSTHTVGTWTDMTESQNPSSACQTISLLVLFTSAVWRDLLVVMQMSLFILEYQHTSPLLWRLLWRFSCYIHTHRSHWHPFNPKDKLEYVCTFSDSHLIGK